MIIQPICRWASRTLASERDHSLVLFFSKSCRSGRQPTSPVSNSLPRRQCPQQLGQYRCIVQDTTKRIVHGNSVDPTESFGPESLDTDYGESSSHSEPRSNAFSTRNEDEPGKYLQEPRAAARAWNLRKDRDRNDGELAVLFELEHALLGTDRSRCKERMKAKVRDACKSGNTKKPGSYLSSLTPEENFFRRWGLGRLQDGNIYRSREISPPTENSADVPLQGMQTHSKDISEDFSRDFVHIVQDLFVEGIQLPGHMIVPCLETSAGLRSPSFMLIFAKRLTRIGAVDIKKTLDIIHRQIQSGIFDRSDPLRCAQLLTILTGFPSGCFEPNETPLQPSIYSMVGNYWSLVASTKFLDCLASLGGSKAVVHLWKHGLESSSKHWKQELEKPLVVKAVEAFIRQLLVVHPSAPELAWELAATLFQHNQDHLIEESTADLLVEWPEFIGEGKLPQYMLKHLLKGMDSYARRIEESLGVSWDAEVKIHAPVNNDMAELMREKGPSMSEASVTADDAQLGSGLDGTKEGDQG